MAGVDLEAQNGVSGGDFGAAPPNYEDMSPQQKHQFLFSEQSVRSAFVRKVYVLVTLMLTVTALMCSIPFIFPSVANWIAQDDSAFWVYLTAIIIFLVITIVLSCVPKLTRTAPINLVCLLIFTLSAGFMTMTICSFYTISSVLICLGMTAAAAFSIIIFATFIKKDLTTLIGFGYLFGMWLMFFGISAVLASVLWDSDFLLVLYGALAAALFMLYLAIDTQLILGGGRFAISPEDYVFAALRIFLDILNIFLYLLAIFGRVK